MKTIKPVLLALLLLLGLSQPFPVGAVGVTRLNAVATTTTSLNLRAGPGAGTAIRRTIPSGANVMVQTGPHNGIWYGVSFAGVFGYVNGNYLNQQPAARQGRLIATAALTLRSGPKATFPPVGVVPRGAQVSIDRKPAEEGWRRVTYEGISGWVLSNSFVRTLGNGGAKRIVVDLSDQWLYAYEGGEEVMRVPVATGRDKFNTPKGFHRILWKSALRNMTGRSLGEEWDVPNVPHAMYLTNTGVALHGTYWHNLFGTGARPSHGCVNLPLESAALLYDWALVGTPVEVRD